jgi:hypothetical protein
MKKIIVFGFAHSGTSIIKSIISHSKDVKEVINEHWEIDTPSLFHKYTICKHPFVEDVFFTPRYEEYIKIFIIRNPLFIYSSLNKRFRKESWYLDVNNVFYGISEFENVCIKYVENLNQPKEDVFLIKYEDMFKNDHKELRAILDKLGLIYTNDIFNNALYENKVISSERLPKDKPMNIDHAKFRTWQINQPFINMNDKSKLDISKKQFDAIVSNEHILKLYPQLKLTSYEQTNQKQR